MNKRNGLMLIVADILSKLKNSSTAEIDNFLGI